ncbi:hypothetical protein [Enterococcus sp. AZ103]|uniref:hypothetical protein n=1 Tax=Enterococcus sp. AZ103 TaxID=2774628 RepID=UPI003F20DDE5
MKYFEINYPYFAIIAANDEVECLEYYKKIIADDLDETEFHDSIESLERTTVINKLASTCGEDSHKVPIGIEEAKKQILESDRSNEPSILALDGSLV